MDYIGPKILREVTENEALDFEVNKKRWNNYNILGSLAALTAVAVGGVINYISGDSHVANRIIEGGLVSLAASAVSTIVNLNVRVENRDGKSYLTALIN